MKAKKKEKKSEKTPIFSARRGKARGQGTAKMATTIHLSTIFFLFFVCQYCSEVAQLGIDCSRSRAYQNILDDPPFDSPFIAGETA